jgi:hypothetical protein
MGITNLVAEFVRVITKIYKDYIPTWCMLYLDNVCVKGPKTEYKGEMVELGIRRFVTKYLLNID